MKVLVGYGSVYVGQRIVKSVMEFQNTEIVGVSREPDEITALVRERDPEVVILDTSLAQGRGLEVLRELKTYAAPPVVIALTSFWNERYMRMYIEAGADYYFHAADEHEKVCDVIVRMLSVSSPSGGLSMADRNE